MALGREIHDRGGLVLLEQLAERGSLANALLLECITRIGLGVGDRLEVRRISQLVDVDDARVRVAEEMTDDCRADEACTARDENR